MTTRWISKNSLEAGRDFSTRKELIKWEVKRAKKHEKENVIDFISNKLADEANNDDFFKYDKIAKKIYKGTYLKDILKEYVEIGDDDESNPFTRISGKK